MTSIIIIIQDRVVTSMSKQKEAIIRVLRETSSHPCAEWIHEEARRDLPGIGLATVYRNLRLLKKEGEVVEIHTSENGGRYDYNTGTHYHFCCDRCGVILDLDEPVDPAIEERVARKTGLQGDTPSSRARRSMPGLSGS
jgi:Fur family transcriptional regulator, peroxide stress response regulator